MILFVIVKLSFQDAKSVMSVNETVQSLPSVSDADCAGVSHDRVLSPEKLVQRLDHFCNDLALNSHKSGYCDLVDFDVEVGFSHKFGKELPMCIF